MLLGALGGEDKVGGEDESREEIFFRAVPMCVIVRFELGLSELMFKWLSVKAMATNKIAIPSDKININFVVLIRMRIPPELCSLSLPQV